MTDHDERAERTASLLGDADTWVDPPDVLSSVMDEVADGGTTGRRRVLVAAAAVVAVVVGVAGFLSTRPEPVDFVLAGTELAPSAEADVRVVETPAGLVYRLDVRGLAPAEPGTYYEGWVESERGSVSVGTFHMRGGDGFVAFWSGVDPVEYPLLVITLEVEEDGPLRSDRVVLTGRT